MVDDTVVGPHHLDAVVRSAATGIAWRLGGGTATSYAGLDVEDTAMAVAAVRVLGADALAPCTLLGQPLDPGDQALVTAALRCFPLGPHASPVDEWQHWGMARAVAEAGGSAASRTREPSADWVAGLSWQVLCRQLAQLAALALPGAVDGLVVAVRSRAQDLAMGCVRALLRRDWLQAAGACRWLTLVGDPSPTLGLAAALDFLDQVARDEPRTLLQVRITRMLDPLESA